MAENNHQLIVTIGAALSGSFNSIVAGSSSKIKQLGGVIKDLEKQSVLSGAAIDKLKLQYNSLLGSMNKQQAILRNRAFYRSQIMEVVAMGAALAVPIKNAMKFEESLAGIKSVVDFPETNGLQKLGALLTDMSRRIPVTADELASVAAIGGRFGVAAGELAKFSEEVAKTSVAWRAPINETVERVGNMMKVFNVTTSQLPQYFDAINHLGNKTGATADNIFKAINRSSDGLANFKLSIPQVAALTSTIISFGEGAEQAGTAVGTMLQKLSIAPQLGTTAQKALHSIGLSSVTLPKMIQEDPQKVLDTLFSGLSQLDPEKRSSALYAIFGRGASKAVGKLIDNLDLYRKNLQLVSDQQNFQGSRDSDYQIVFETAQSQLNLLGNTFSSFSKAIGFSLLPTSQSVVTAINEILTPIVAWMEKNKELTQTITTTVAGFISFRVATFALGYASTFLFGGLNRLVIAFKGLRLAITLVGTTFKAFLGWPAALATAAWLIWDNWESVANFLANIWKPVAPYWDAFIAKIKQFAFVDDIIKAWERVKTFFKGFFDYLTPLWDKFSNIFSSDGGIVSKFKNAFGFGEGKKSPTLNIPKVSNPQSEMTRNQNNNFAITINAAKNDDSESIANKVMNRVSDFSKTFLYDEATEVI